MSVEYRLQLFVEEFTGSARKNVDLAPLTYYRIGGPAAVVVEVESFKDLEQALKLIAKHQIPFWILGSASNLLIADVGLKGVVIRIANADERVISKQREEGDFVWLRVLASCAKATLLDYAVEHCLEGLEFSAGIPGSLGGAVAMNAGTKWGHYAQVIEEVEFCSLDRGVFTLSNKDIGFRYRGLGEGILDDNTIVFAMTLKLKKSKDNIAIKNKVNEILSYRGFKQPLELPNCGSVFKNPEAGPGAGRLIEACGLRGTQIGQARVSTKHANFIQNLGEAKAADVKNLIEHIQKVVLQEKKVKLETEVRLLGFS